MLRTEIRVVILIAVALLAWNVGSAVADGEEWGEDCESYWCEQQCGGEDDCDGCCYTTTQVCWGGCDPPPGGQGCLDQCTDWHYDCTEVCGSGWCVSCT